MIIKTFKIMSNRGDFLTNDILAQALLDQITLQKSSQDVFFAVTECDPMRNIQLKADRYSSFLHGQSYKINDKT